MNLHLSLAIVTKARIDKLERCLRSIVEQTLLPDEVLIIDNDRLGSARRVIDKFKDKLNVKYFLEKRDGVARARNTALKKASEKYLGFVDDDCILDNLWVESAVRALNSETRLAYVVGNTALYNNKNIVAMAQYLRDRHWYLEHLQKGSRATAEHFDTKNVVFDREKVLRVGLRFDPKCGLRQFDSADFDFGIQLARKSLKGKYVSSMKLAHEETTNLKRFVERARARGYLAAYIYRKWKMRTEGVDLSQANILIWALKGLKNFPKDLLRYSDGRDEVLIKMVLVVLIIRLYELAYLRGYISYTNLS